MLQLVELYSEIEETYSALEEITKRYRETSNTVAVKEREIDLAKAKLYDEGLINGKNAEIRDAQVKLNLNEDFEELDLLKTKESNAKLELELVSIKIEKLRALLRVEEVVASHLSGDKDRSRLL